MSMYTAFDKTTGEIVKTITCPKEFLELNLSENEDFVEGLYGHDCYVSLPDKTVLTRKDYDIGSLPVPCTVSIEGMDYYCADQPVFQFDVPGIYTVAVDAGAEYMKKEFEIDCRS